jgi:protein O-GlcNAc transferase
MGARTQTSLLHRLLAVSVACAVAALHVTVNARAQQQPPDATFDPARVAQIVVRVRAARADDALLTQASAIAFALIGAGRYAEALSLFEALREKQPRDPSALYGVALATFNLRRVAEAEPRARDAADAALARIASNAPDPSVLRRQAADALVLLAVIQAVRGDNGAALASAQRATELAPQHFDAQFTLGRARYGAGDPAGAAQAFRAAVALNPTDARARFFLATALEHAGDETSALAAYRELIARAPANAEGHTGLGVLLVKHGGADTLEGLQELQRAVALDPDAYEARVALGRTLVQQGRAQDAVAHLQRAAQLAPNNPEPHYQLAIAYRRLGRAQEAAAESAIVKQIHEARRQASGGNAAASPPDN